MLSQHPDFNTFVVCNFGLEELVWNGISNPGEWYDYFTGKKFSTLQNLNVLLAPGQFHVFTSIAQAQPEANLVPWANLVPVTATEINTQPQARIFPNPSQEILILEVEGEYRGNIDLEITSLSGQRISYFRPEKTQNKLTQHLPIREINPGMYLLKIRQGDKIEIKKFLKE